MTAIREAKNLDTLGLDKLMGSLLTLEIERKASPTEEATTKTKALKTSSSEKNKNKYFKKKSTTTSWSGDLKTNSSSEEERPNICFMAHSYENEVISSERDSNSLSYKELEHGFKKINKDL